MFLCKGFFRQWGRHSEKKIRTILFALGALLIFAHGAESGAAVAMRNKPKGGMKNAQLPPGYRIGPNGIEKIPQDDERPGENEQAGESAEQEAAEVKDEAGLQEVIEALQVSGQSWELIVRRQDKQMIVEEFIKKYAGQGIVIQKPASYYASFIDDIARSNPDMLQAPFDRVLQIVAIMEYDFDNGQNKDMLAQKILGPQAYQKNRQRLMQMSGQAR